MPGFFCLFFTSGTLLPRILNTQRAHNNQQFTETALRIRSHKHPGQLWIYRQTGHLPTCLRELLLPVNSV